MEDAGFSWKEGSGWVRYDTTRTSPGEFLGELHRMTDYRATVRAGKGEEPHE